MYATIDSFNFLCARLNVIYEDYIFGSVGRDRPTEPKMRFFFGIYTNFSLNRATLKSIREHLKPEEEKDEPDTEKIEVSQNLFAAMHYYATNAKMTVVQLLEEIFQPRMDCANWHMEKKIDAWQEDLEKMVNEYGNSA